MRSRKFPANRFGLSWPTGTELIGLRFRVQPVNPSTVYAQYTTGLHAWFLDQVRQIDPGLSQLLHDEVTEKAFTLSGLDGQFVRSGQQVSLHPQQTYDWTVTAFSQPVVQWLAQWLARMPERIELHHAPLSILGVELGLPPLRYADFEEPRAGQSLELSFVTPTSFRRKGNHFPLPLPQNLFQSYARRWNEFSRMPLELEPFLDWIDTYVVIQRYSLQSSKVAVGKRGSVTGGVGAIALGVSGKGMESTDYAQWFYRLGQFAPYCGTGHKTTFGLGQTVLGWVLPEDRVLPISGAEVVDARIAELTAFFFAQKKRTGGDRARQSAETWATILARREQGESLMAIAEDLGMKHDTVNRYAKYARQALGESVNSEV